VTIEDDKNVLAAEYVLGTLDTDERALAEELIALDPGFEVIIQQWERRLGELSAMVDPVEPPEEIWQKIDGQLPLRPKTEAAVELAPPAAPAPVAEASDNITFADIAPDKAANDVAPLPTATAEPVAETPPEAAAPERRPALDPDLFAAALAEPEPTRPPEAAPERLREPAEPPPAFRTIDMRQGGAEIRTLSRRVNRWRAATGLMTTLAACLVGLIAARELIPERLPPRLRPTPVVHNVPVDRIVEVPVPSQAPAEFVAILQKDAFSPAFMLTFDTARRILTVRAVGAERQAGKSYELWLVSNRYPAPRSLGVIGPDQFTQKPTLAEYDPVTINTATFAVSLEPEGGSPNGQPTEVLYTGKLLQTTPPGFPMQTP
jgi:anti-sigma-K factor RskA